MSAFAGMEGFDGAILAEKPVIIFGWDGVPKYFEWRVFKNGEIVGAIVASASKLICRPVAYVLRMVNSYGVLTNFPADTVIIDNNYPDFVFGKVDTNTQCVTEAIDPYAGTNITIQKEIFTLMKERPSLFTNEGNSIAGIILFTTLYPFYSKAYWADVDEQQMIAVSYLGPLAVSSNRFTTLVQDWESGKVVDGFTGLDWGYSPIGQHIWWDWDWVNAFLLWGNSPHDKFWCGPTAGAIMLCYYGYTNKIRWYEYNITNIYYYYATTKKSTNFQFVLDKTIDLKGLPTSMKMNILFSSPSFYNNGNPNSDSISYVSGSAIPQDYPFTVSMMYSGDHYSPPYYYFEYINFQYSSVTSFPRYDTRFLFAFDVFVSNRNPGPAASPIPLSGMFVFKRDGWPWTYETVRTEYFNYELFQYKISTNAPLNLNPQDWVFVKTITNINSYIYDGYHRFGYEMGIRDWENGGAGAWEVERGIEWASENNLSISTTTAYWYFSLGELWHQYLVYEKVKESVDKNDLTIIGRYSYTDDDGKTADSHWRVALGYKTSGDNYYILLTDNGSESEHHYALKKTFINSINVRYCTYIFWENTLAIGYKYCGTIYKD